MTTPQERDEQPVDETVDGEPVEVEGGDGEHDDAAVDRDSGKR